MAKPTITAPSSTEAAALNRAFYGSDPANFCQRRLINLIAIASSSDAEAHQITFGKLKLTRPSIDDSPADERTRKAYVAIETEMLLHHAAETLLRMFFAHRDRGPVPWIELSRLRGARRVQEET
jgi:hypothetical protein